MAICQRRDDLLGVADKLPVQVLFVGSVRVGKRLDKLGHLGLALVAADVLMELIVRLALLPGRLQVKVGFAVLGILGGVGVSDVLGLLPVLGDGPQSLAGSLGLGRIIGVHLIVEEGAGLHLQQFKAKLAVLGVLLVLSEAALLGRLV